MSYSGAAFVAALADWLPWLSHSELKLMLWLATHDYVGDCYFCDAELPELLRAVGGGERYVRNALRLLVRQGALNTRSEGKQRYYALNPDWSPQGAF